MVFVKPVLTAVHFAPLFVETKTPLSVPAKRVVPPNPPPEGDAARDQTFELVNPEATALQLPPLLVERKTPLV